MHQTNLVNILIHLLILKSKKGIYNHEIPKSNEGIETNELNNLLNIFDKFSYNPFMRNLC